jgi:NAD(P)-dependent dehydrogenase (short-subunit alcohol dehydrogenase family)
MELGLQGKIALVTGGNSGIGRAIALEFAREGAELILVARDQAKGEDTCRAIGEIGGKSEFHSVELSDHVAVEALMKDVDAKHGRLHALVNCAGGGEAKQNVPAGSSLIERWNGMSGGNFLSAYLVTGYAIPIMQKTGGSIVNITSTATLHANYWLYGAMKAGLDGLTRSMAGEYAAHGIRANAIGPGWIKTEGNAPDPGNTAAAEWEKTTSLFGRMGSTDEIAAATLFLASDRASFITGQTLYVDGGLTIVDATVRETMARAQVSSQWR